MSSRRHTILCRARLALIVAGSVALGLCAFAYLKSKGFQQRNQAEFNKAPFASHQHTRHPVDRGPAARPFSVRVGEPFGRIDIPRLGMSVIVVEGARSRDLLVGAGHIPGTAFPHDSGNVGIAGHRDTFFRELRNIRHGDRVTIQTAQGAYLYVVQWTRVVKPTQVDVLRSSGERTLTLVTCYPFSYIGHAPKRFIVRARQDI